MMRAHAVRRQVLLLVTACAVAGPGLRAQESYEDFVKKQKEGEQQEKEAFARYKESVTAEYQRFLEQDRREFQQYVEGIRKQWGSERARTSTRKEWVAYDGDFGGRRSVDFESGRVSVEVLVPKDAPDEEVRRRIEEQILKVVADRGDTDPLEARSKAPSPTPVLEGLLTTRDDAPVSADNAGEYAAQVLRASQVRREPVVGGDGAPRLAARVSFQLIPNHLRVRAEKYRPAVGKNASRFTMDAPLIFAVIHTESYFNPRARSPVPAYGLMQLVPQSGARAAYLHVHGEDKLVTADHLYDPDNNIELGSGYLSLLMTKEFKEVRDPLSRAYCAVAAYNTGPANVAKAFVGKRKIPEAVQRINTMTPEQVFAHLRANLPFAETRNYIVNVTDRAKLYEEWR